MTKSTDIRALKNLNQPTRYSIPSVKGLHLWVRPDLKKYWVFRYTRNKSRHDISLGPFPEITLNDAKTKATKLRARLLNGVDPATERKIQRQTVAEVKPTMPFEKYALQYIETMSDGWSNSKHASQWENTLRTYAFPLIGNMNIESIKTSHILEILSPIWGTKNETATRVRGRLEKILSASITSGHRESSNPALWRGHLENLLPKIRRLQDHHSALPYQELPNFMMRLRSVKGMSSLALQFTILNASRTGEVLLAKKTEVEGDLWTIPPQRMKARREHQVPLCSRSLELIEEAKLLHPESDYIFGTGNTHLSSMAMLMLVRRVRTGVTVHGFRSAFRDWVSEETDHSPEVAEMALAHTIGNKVEAAYRRGKLVERRRILMADWQNYCLSVNSQNLSMTITNSPPEGKLSEALKA